METADNALDGNSDAATPLSWEANLVDGFEGDSFSPLGGSTIVTMSSNVPDQSNSSEMSPLAVPAR